MKPEPGNTTKPADFTATPDWNNLPAPVDDGAAGHLPGMKIRSIALVGTDGCRIDLSALAGWAVVYAYPRTGVPDAPNPDGWDAIPGARGWHATVLCVSRSFRGAGSAWHGWRLQLPEEFEASDWIADNFIAWWRDEANDSLGSAELAACRLRDELTSARSTITLDEALHEITHVQEALSDMRERLGLAAD